MVPWDLLTCFSRKIDNNKYITNEYFYNNFYNNFKMSSKRTHNHNATAEVDCLENKTNNETDKPCFNAYLLDFFRFSSS